MKLYFLQNLNAGYLGNSPMFLAKAGGYTQWIDEAQQFTPSECAQIIRSTRGSHKWKRWPVGLIEKHSQRTVDIQKLRKPAKV